MPKLNSLEVVHQDTNKDSYETLHDIIVGLKGSQNQEVVDNGARALYESLLELYTNDKEAFAKRIETLQAEFGNSLAQVVEEVSAYANASEASARRINTVSAKIDSSNAMVRQEMTARATEDEALAQLITTLEAQVDSNTAAITSEATARATEDEALAQLITTLEAQVDSNTAAITEESTARANADSALASQITTLSATVGSKNRTYYQSTAPASGMVSGDLWIDSDDDKLYRYDGSTWANIQDNQIGVNTAAISNEATVRATADSANTTAINAVTARLDTGDFATVKTTSEASALKLQTRANLVSEISNWSLGSFALTQSGVWGMTATSTSSGTLVAESPFFDVSENTAYTITGDSLNFNSSGSSFFDIIFYNSSNTVVGDSAQNAINGIHDFSATDSNRNAHAIAVTSPSTAVKAKARYVCTSSGAVTGFRQVKVERGGLPATPFSQETTVNYASAKWGVTVDANGYAAGIALMANSTGTSEFVVAANKFRVKKPDGTDGISWNGTNSRLDISGDVYANAFYGNVVSTNNMNSGAVGNISAVSSASNSTSTVLNVSGVSGETYILYILAQWPQTYYATTTIYLNGSPLRTAAPLAGNEGSLMVTTTVSPGSYTIQATNGDSRNAYMALYTQVIKR